MGMVHFCDSPFEFGGSAEGPTIALWLWFFAMILKGSCSCSALRSSRGSTSPDTNQAEAPAWLSICIVAHTLHIGPLTSQSPGTAFLLKKFPFLVYKHVPLMLLIAFVL